MNYANNTVISTESQEKVVLMSLLMNPMFIPSAKMIVKDAMFSRDEYKKVWRLMEESTDPENEIDISTIQSKIKPDTYVSITSTTYSCNPATVEQYCRILAQSAVRRTISKAGLNFNSMANDNETDFDSLVSLPGQLIDSIQELSTNTGVIALRDAINHFADDIGQMEERMAKGERTNIPTGFAMLDQLTYGGFGPGDLVILSARPSVGKTAVMIQMAIVASRANVKTIIYSLETKETQIAKRCLLSTGMITARQINALSHDEQFPWNEFERSAKGLDGLPLGIVENAHTLDDICNSIALEHQRGKCDIAYIDYLGLINPRIGQNDYGMITESTRRFKRLALQLGIPIVILSQLNRDSAKDKEDSVSNGRSPELFDLRTCGSIEQDADVVLMMERHGRDLTSQDVDMWVRKNRNGKAGEICVELTGNETFTWFEPRTNQE